MMLYEVNQGRIGLGQCIDEQLLAMGIRDSDLDAVLLTHLDCDHANGLVQVKGAKKFLVAADEVIVTVNPQLLAMKGLQDFLKTVKKIKSRINEKLEVAGILLTMCDARTILCKTITLQVTETFNAQIRIFKSKIPSTRKGESAYYSEPLIEYTQGCNACKAYERLAGEVIVDEG